MRKKNLKDKYVKQCFYTNLKNKRNILIKKEVNNKFEIKILEKNDKNHDFFPL